MGNLSAAGEKIPLLHRIQFATRGGSVRTLTPEKGGECFTFTGTQQNFRLKSNQAALEFRLHEPQARRPLFLSVRVVFNGQRHAGGRSGG
jgi:hypothetical protein